jgi:hypothetical protein
MMAHILAMECRWPIATVSAVRRDVWSWGYTGSDRTTVETALSTRGRHQRPCASIIANTTGAERNVGALGLKLDARAPEGLAHSLA